MKKIITRIGSKGDTIIEVLLAIAVLSMVLSVSYGLANRSSQATRQAQERGEAQKLAEEQLELLRSYFSPDQPWEDDNNYQCFNTDGDPTSNPEECLRGPNDRYKIEDIDQIDNTFTVHMSWYNVRGGTDELSLAYKLPITGDILSTPHYACDDRIDNDGDELIDHVSVNPTNPDPDCTSATSDTEVTPPPPPVTLTVQPSGGGTVTGTSINCGSTCTRSNITNGENIILTATPATNYTFSGWTPSNCGNFSITSNTICKANFTYKPPRVPLHRCYSIYTGGDYRFVTDHHFGVPGAGSCYPTIHNDAWYINYEGIAGYVPTDSTYPKAYVYGGWNAETCGGWVNPWPYWDHFYTASYDDYVGAHYAGWCNETGYQGWSVLTDNSAPGSVPMYRWWHAGVGDHFYTTSWQEGVNSGYTYEGILGYVYSSP